MASGDNSVAEPPTGTAWHGRPPLPWAAVTTDARFSRRRRRGAFPGKLPHIYSMPTIEFQSSCHLCLDVDAAITIDEWVDNVEPTLPIQTAFLGGLECPNCYWPAATVASPSPGRPARQRPVLSCRPESWAEQYPAAGRIRRLIPVLDPVRQACPHPPPQRADSCLAAGASASGRVLNPLGVTDLDRFGSVAGSGMPDSVLNWGGQGAPTACTNLAHSLRPLRKRCLATRSPERPI